MTPFNNIKNIYFLGIGGIGMSALARYFVLNGKTVAGYDKTPSRMTTTLKETGIQLSFNTAIEGIPASFQDKTDTLVVYTAAVSEENELFQFFKTNNFNIEKRSVVLGEITAQMPTLAVAGTHGKTTTSAILAHLLKQSGYKITAFLGGISENYHSNFIGDGHDAAVVEADEFDRSFLQLSPDFAAITSMDADHLDIYGKAEDLMASFHQFAEKVKNSDHLFFKKGLPLKGNSVAIEDEADYSIQKSKIENGIYHFDLKTPEQTISGFEFNLPGKHNLMNAGMALAMALKVGADVEKLKPALKNFRGVERRFSYHLKTDKKVLIEDYAHHPAEISAVHQAVREMHPQKKIAVVFQPHLFSRTKDFANAFAKSLALFDEIFLLPIYPAREEPIPGVDSEMVLRLIENPQKKLIQKSQLGEVLKKSDAEVILLLGAGDIGNEVERVKKALTDEI